MHYIKEHRQNTDLKYRLFFARQVKQLRTLQNINDKEELLKELNISAMKVIQNQRQLQLSLIVMVFLSVSAYTLAIYLRRSHRLKKRIGEREILVNRIPTRAEPKADNASRMKSTFIANISHEIRSSIS